MVPVWKKIEFTDFKKPIPFFNLNPIKQLALRSSWYSLETQTQDREDFGDDIGPSKKTILVSGANVKKIENTI